MRLGFEQIQYKFYPRASRMTIGGGRYGLDSIRLKELFNLGVTPTSIVESALLKSKNLGLIDKYYVENAIFSK